MTVTELRKALKGKDGDMEIVVARMGEVFSQEIKSIKEGNQICVEKPDKRVLMVIT